MHDEVYKEQVKGFKQSFTKNYVKVPDASIVAKKIVKEVTKRKSKVRYRVAGATTLAFLKRMLPTRIFDAVVSKAMGQ